MDPQQIEHEIPSERTRSYSSHFPSTMHSYADGIHSFFESTIQNSSHENQGQSNVSNNEETNGSTSQREQLTGTQRNLRDGLEQFRMSLDSREGQTAVSIAKNLFPFIALFAAKFMLDHLYDILELGLVLAVFLQADVYVRKIVSDGIENKIIQATYCTAYILMVVIFLQVYSLTDFSFSNTFGLNILYFLSGEFKSLSTSSTLYGVIFIDSSFKLITIIPKLIFVHIPERIISMSFKRKLLQSIEYCSELYRCALPFGPWTRYFLFVNVGSGFMIYLFTIVYFSLKVGEIYRYSLFVRKSLKCLLTDSSVGTSVKLFDCADKKCSVCHDDLEQPIQLECKHIFCKTCIERWLDQNSTCPICRAEVTKDVDNEWKNGGTSLALRMF